MHIHNENNPKAVQIRHAVRDDAEAIARLFLISSDGLAAYVWSRDKPSGTDLLEHGANRYARSGTAFSYENCWVAKVSGNVVGMIHAFPMPIGDRAVEDDPILKPYADLEVPGSVYVSGIAVQEEYRGRGIGTLLLDQVEDAAATNDHISLICFEQNDRAMTLYRRRSFVEVKRRPLVPHPTLKYTQGDAVLLAKQLQQTPAVTRFQAEPV
ncbi:GNAT family N-acetyltransferase [Yoonia sediminilitoris]|uniref:Acetyltransferase (GNAT) family protein n=1 Tax=Yoonia sediminilitoris TaxID=1286148 RepID=A0A2T6K6X8_9RHOB|nr:GNAT family N-acetyltransferase [Yoonia sediminilitoris]PUB10400.1 acetyltransferase (GNAT) family protein [Yoonia sediminilitoris]RCW89866.1 acetyltransferase (GNAT) family protein [Yoonia sediminilitoris]